jgi:hypothetical protein
VLTNFLSAGESRASGVKKQGELRAIPYVRAWDEKYKDQGLEVIGEYAP